MSMLVIRPHVTEGRSLAIHTRCAGLKVTVSDGDAGGMAGTLEEVVKKQNVNFLKQLLSGHMLAELTYSHVLADMISQYSEKKL
jgi:hypothetical protein